MGKGEIMRNPCFLIAVPTSKKDVMGSYRPDLQKSWGPHLMQAETPMALLVRWQRLIHSYQQNPKE